MANPSAFPLRGTLLLAAAVLVSAALVAWQVGRDTARAADRTLSTLRLTQQLVETQRDRDLTTRGELIAGNQAVVGYMTQALGSALPGESVDRSSIVDLLEERRSQLGLDVAAAIGADGSLLATTDRSLETHDFAADPVFATARKSQAPRAGLWSDGERLLHVAMLPLARYGSDDAYLLVGQDIGQDYVQTIARIGGGDVAIIAPSPAGPRVAASTMDSADSAAVATALRTRGSDGRTRLAASARDAQAQSAALFGNQDVRVLTVAGDPSPGFAVAAHLPMILLAGVALLALAAALAWYQRKVVLPLQALAGLMGRAAETGDHHLHAAEQGAPVVVRLAQAFNRLMGARNGRHD